jgi:tetratricopeptide (TPR) repeat protein
MMKRLIPLILMLAIAAPALAAPPPPRPAGCTDRSLHADDYYYRGNDYFNEGLYRQAIRNYDCAIALRSANLDARYWRALAYYYLDEYEQALGAYTDYLDYVPDDQYALTDRGQTYYFLGDYDSALADFDAALALYPDDGYAYNWRGWLHYMTGDFEQALADYRQTLTFSPDIYVVHIDIAVAYAELGDVEQAAAEYRLLGELDPTYSIFSTESGEAFYNDYVEVYSTAIDRWPDNFISRTFRGSIYARVGMTAEAMADFTRAIAAAPNFPEAYAGLGMVYDQLNQADSALENYRRYLELADNPEPSIVERVAELEKTG